MTEVGNYDNGRYGRQSGGANDTISLPNVGRKPAAGKGQECSAGSSARQRNAAREVRISGVPQAASRRGAESVRGAAGTARSRNESGTQRAARTSRRLDGAGSRRQSVSAQDPRMRARAAEKRRRRRQRRRLIHLCVAVFLLIAVVCGVIAFRSIRKTQQIDTLKQEGIAADESGNYQEAVDKFGQALELSGSRTGAEQTDIRVRLAEAQYDMKDYSASLEGWKSLLEMDEDNEDYKKNVVLCLIDLGQYDEAMTYGVLQSRIYNKMAVEKIRTGDYEGALDDIDRGLIVDDGTAAADLIYNQAVVYENQGEYEKALAQFEDYISRFGDDENVQKEIEFLQSRTGGTQTQETTEADGEAQEAE